MCIRDSFLGPLRLPITGSYLQVLVENYRFPFKRLHNMAKRYNISLLGMYCGPFLTVVACDAKSVRELLLHPDLQRRVDGFARRLRGLGNLLGKLMYEYYVDIILSKILYT